MRVTVVSGGAWVCLHARTLALPQDTGVALVWTRGQLAPTSRFLTHRKGSGVLADAQKSGKALHLKSYRLPWKNPLHRCAGKAVRERFIADPNILCSLLTPSARITLIPNIGKETPNPARDRTPAALGMIFEDRLPKFTVLPRPSEFLQGREQRIDPTGQAKIAETLKAADQFMPIVRCAF